MPNTLSRNYCAFEGQRLLHSGPIVDVARVVKERFRANPDSQILVFDDSTGRVVDLDLRGSDAELVARLTASSGATIAKSGASTEPHATAAAPRGRGRPKLGVVAREVTLLPRQWEWLSAQPGGASAILRRLVDEARRGENPARQRRDAQATAYQFMLAIAGDMPGYEEATRALFADDRAALETHIAQWPVDVRRHVLRLAFDAPAHHSTDPSG